MTNSFYVELVTYAFWYKIVFMLLDIFAKCGHTTQVHSSGVRLNFTGGIDKMFVSVLEICLSVSPRLEGHFLGETPNFPRGLF